MNNKRIILALVEFVKKDNQLLQTILESTKDNYLKEKALLNIQNNNIFIEIYNNQII